MFSGFGDFVKMVAVFDITRALAIAIQYGYMCRAAARKDVRPFVGINHRVNSQ